MESIGVAIRKIVLLVGFSLLLLFAPCDSFLLSTGGAVHTKTTRIQQHIPPILRSSATTDSIPTLTEKSTWKVRLVLENSSSTPTPTTTISLTGQFVDDEGYEPPQGVFRLCPDTNEETKVQIVNSRWMLSEDPDDRKDGLWIWGLFRFETCFPYLLLTLELLEDDDDDEKSNTVPMRFYARVPHKREEDGTTTLETAPLELQRTEQYNADPLGFAKVDLVDSVTVGRISFFPVSGAF